MMLARTFLTLLAVATQGFLAPAPVSFKQSRSSLFARSKDDASNELQPSRTRRTLKRIAKVTSATVFGVTMATRGAYASDVVMQQPAATEEGVVIEREEDDVDFDGDFDR